MTEIKPIGVQRMRTKGWRMPENTASVARPGTWGNPHKVGRIDAKTAVLRYEKDLLNRNLTDRHGVPLIDRIEELRGKNLACFCSIGDPCHRDVLLKYANQ
jgi:Domain of unknown function (DUF4326)